MAADTIVTGSKLTAIANAIRAKLGVATQYTLDQMAAAIASIPTGAADNRLWRQMLGVGGFVSPQSDTWCEYEITSSDKAALLAAVAEGLTPPYTGLNTRSLRPFAFAYSQGLKSFYVPNGLELGPYCFTKSHLEEITFEGSWSCANWGSTNDGFNTTGNSPSSATSPFMDAVRLESLDLSGMTSVAYSLPSYLVAGCKALESLTLPSWATRINNGAFTNCESLTRIEIPASVTNMYQNASETAKGCTALEELDILGNPGIYGGKYGAWFGTSGWGSSNTTFKRLIIRGTTMAEICSSSGTTITDGYLFGATYSNGDYVANVPANLTIYVSDALVATYKADTNWGRYSSIITGISNLSQGA